MEKEREAHRRSYFVRTRNAGITAATCAGVGFCATYLVSGPTLLRIIIGTISLFATLTLTLGVYILYEPISDDLEEFIELTRTSDQSADDATPPEKPDLQP